MIIENKWVVHDRRDDVYYTGDDESGGPVLESLNSRVRTYKNERGAKGAIRHIQFSGSEKSEFCELEAVKIEKEEVKDVEVENPARPPDEPQLEMVENVSGWETVYGFAFPIERLETLFYEDEKIRTSEKFSETRFRKQTVAVGDFGKIFLCRKVVGKREMFGVKCADGKIYSAGFGGGAVVLEKFCEECKTYLLPRVTKEVK